MVQGAGRPGQPNIGQPSIFGNGGPSFAQMPSFTPVTRGGPQPAAAPQAPYPTQAQPQQPAAPVQPAPGQPAFQAPPEQAYPQAQYPQAKQPQAQVAQPQVAQPQVAHPQAAQQPQPAQPQAYTGGQPLQPMAPAHPTAQPQPQAYEAPNAPQSALDDLPDLSNADPGFPESIFGDIQVGGPFSEEPQGAAPHLEANPSFPETHQAGLPEPSAADAAYQAPPAGMDAQFDPAFGAAQAQQPENYHPQAYAQSMPAAQNPMPAAQDPMPAAHDPALYAQGVAHGQVPPVDPSRQLQAFDTNYGGQPPQIPLGDPQAGMQPSPHDFFEADRGDADFMDESQVAPQTGIKSKMMSSIKGRSAVMVASALLGAIALGGALAYAYQQSGGGIGSGDAPIITADASPVKEVPNQPGGKEFPHKNKLIYDRLTNGNTPESERLVPRQEDVAVPALPPATATAGLPVPVATTDLTNPAPAQSVGDDGGPRKVKTIVVRPDGSMEGPPVAAAAATANQAIAGATSKATNMMPVPAIAPPGAPQQVAAAAPAAAAAAPAAAAAAPAAAAAGSAFVVQLGAWKSQTDALANFADAQQKYPSLLGKYQPLVRKTNLGPKGTWYRLQVGPTADKTAAYKLCGQLKAKGHSDCLVMAQ